MKNHIFKILNGPVDKYKQYSQLKKNVLSGTIYSVINAIATVIAYPIYLKYLGAEKFGLWSIIAVVFVFSQFGQMGMDTAIIKYIANEFGRKNYKGITEYMSTSFYILLGPSLIIIIIMFFFRSQIADFMKLNEVFKNEGIRLMLYVGLLSVFSFFVFILKGLVIGIGRMDIANYVFLSGKILEITVSVILLMLGMGIWSLFYGFCTYFIVPTIIWFIMLKFKYQIKVFEFRAFNKEKMRELLKYGGTLMVGTIAHMFVIPFNKIIIGRYVGLAEVAYYQIAVNVIMSFRNLFVKGLESILPKISEIHGKGIETFESVFSIHKKGMKIIFLFAMPLFLLLFVFAEPLVRFWLRGEFDMQIVLAMKILLIGWCVNALAVPDYYMFLGIGKPGYGVSATCIKSFSNVILILILLLFSITISLTKVVVIDSVSLVMAVIFLKYKYFEFKKIKRSVQN